MHKDEWTVGLQEDPSAFWCCLVLDQSIWGVSKQRQAEITHSQSYSCCGMQAGRIGDWLMGCSKTGAGVQYYLNNHKIMSFSVPRPPTTRLGVFCSKRRRGVSTWGWWKQLTKPQLYSCCFYSLNRLQIISRTWWNHYKLQHFYITTGCGCCSNTWIWKLTQC